MNEELADIKLFLLDMDGTVYLEGSPLPGAAAAIERIRQSGRKVCFLTNNSSRSAESYLEKLASMGIAAQQGEVYTSGQATTEYLTSQYPGAKVYLVGTDSLKREFASAGIRLTEDDPDVVVLGFDTTLTYQKLVKLTRFIRGGAAFIATHPDINCPAPVSYVPDVGAMLALVEASTGMRPSAVCGKPFRPMGQAVMKRFSLRAEQIAMVGDRLSTDMLFAENNGFFSVLVLSGETDEEMLAKSRVKPRAVLKSLAEVPDYFFGD